MTTTQTTVDRRRSLLIRERPLGATERVSVTGGHKLKCGTVLGRLRDSGWYAPLDLNATDGTQYAAGVLVEDLHVTPAPADVVVHAAALNGALLVWPETLTAEQHARALGQL